MVSRAVLLALALLIPTAFGDAAFSGALETSVKRYTCVQAFDDVILRMTVIYPGIVEAFLKEDLTELERTSLMSLSEQIERDGAVITVFSANLRVSVDAPPRDRVTIELPGYSVAPPHYRAGFQPDELYEPLEAYGLSAEESLMLPLSDSPRPYIVLNFGAHPEAFAAYGAYLLGPFTARTYLQNQSSPVETQLEGMRCIYSSQDGVLGGPLSGGTNVISQDYLRGLLSALLQTDLAASRTE